tara:strand:- start:423 stop:596 length:174 start_codon:yes stop_codon:yes gene_type:complete
MSNKVLETNTISELDFRIKFRDEYGIDYQDATKELEERRHETERVWHQLLVSHGVIK